LLSVKAGIGKEDHQTKAEHNRYLTVNLDRNPPPPVRSLNKHSFQPLYGEETHIDDGSEDEENKDQNEDDDDHQMEDISQSASWKKVTTLYHVTSNAAAIQKKSKA